MEERTIQLGRVLIVDDEPPNILLLERILQRADFTSLRSTSDPRGVLSIFAEFRPDILLLDLHMPGLNGFEVMEQLKGFVGDETYLPILVLTADMSGAVKQRALACGAKDFLTKPFDVTEVVLRIKNLLLSRCSASSTKRHGNPSRIRSTGSCERAWWSGWQTTPSSSPGTGGRFPLTIPALRSGAMTKPSPGWCWSSGM
jgi:DNA-binding response OmpR family regulator